MTTLNEHIGHSLISESLPFVPNFAIEEYDFSKYRSPKFFQVHFCIDLHAQLLPNNLLLFIDFPAPNFAAGISDVHYRAFECPRSPVLLQEFEPSL